jgi:hypothetical protein
MVVMGVAAIPVDIRAGTVVIIAESSRHDSSSVATLSRFGEWV